MRDLTKTNPKRPSAKRSRSPKRRPTSAPDEPALAAAPDVPAIPATQNARPASLPPLLLQDLSDPDAPLLEDRSCRSAPFGNTPLAAAFRFIKPSWRNYVQYVDLEARSGNLDARRYLDTLLALPLSERRSHYPEQICELANVQTDQLVRWVTGNAWLERDVDRAMCLSFLAVPVLEKVAEFAMASPDNYKSADQFLRSAGLLAQNSRSGGTPRAPANVIYNMPVASGSAVSSSAAVSAAPDRSGLRDMDGEIVELSKIMQTGGVACAAEAAEDAVDEPDGADDDDDSEEDPDED